jgi:MoaA/NifB/PqqE/SkfB family radical SAM enzyme
MYRPSLSIDYTTQRQHNKILNYQEYASGKIFLESKPRILFMEITRNCNFYCWMCRQKNKWKKDWDMDWLLFKEVADELFPYVEIVDLRGWGESTLLPWFSTAVEYSRSFGCQVKLYTNLSVTNKKILRTLVANDAWIAVSFDGASKQTFESLRKGADYSKIMENLDFLVDLSVKMDKPLDRLYLSVTVQQDNLHEITEIISIAHKYQLGCVKLFPVICEHDSPKHLGNSISRLVNTIDNIYDVSRELNMPVEFGASLDQSIALPDHLLKKCMHPWSHGYISCQGGVGFCDHLIGNDNYVFGNLREANFHSIWNNERFRNLRREHGGGENSISGNHDACKWCFKNRYVDIEHLLATENLEKIVSTVGETKSLYRLSEGSNEKLQFVSGLLP